MRAPSRVRPSGQGRLRRSAATLLAIGAVLAIATAIPLATVSLLEREGTRGIQAELANRVGADLALAASIALSSNPEQQDREVRAAIADTFAPSGVGVAVTRTIDADVTVQPVAEDAEGRAGSVRSIPDLDELTTFVAGAGPVAPNEVAVQADAAEALGLEPGAEVLIAGERFVVVGTWRARDPLDPRWFGDPMVATGVDGAFGPFVIDEAAWSRLDVLATATWTIVLDATAIDAGNVAALIRGWERIRVDWRPKVTGMTSLTSQNPLVVSLQAVETRIDGLRAIEPVVFALVVLAALVGLAELIRLLVATRRRVTLLYWARGDSRFGIARRTGMDVALAAILGTVAGAALAAAAIAALWGPDALAALRPLAALPTAIVLIGAIVMAAVLSRPDEPTARTARTSRTGVRRAILPGVAVLAALAATLMTWQLRLYGSPFTPTVDGVGDVDPVAVLAPAVLLAAIVLGGVALLPRVAGVGRRLVRGRSVAAQLAARGILARIALLGAPLVLMALASGTATVAAAYSATWSHAFAETAALRSGADLHVSSRETGLSPGVQDAVLTLPEVDAAAPLEVQPLSVGGESGSLLAATPGAVAALATSAPESFDAAAIAGVLGAELPGPVLPADASAGRLVVTASALVGAPAVTVHLADELGFLRAVPAELEAAEGEAALRFTYSFAVPGTPGPWRVAAVDFAVAAQDVAADRPQVALAALSAIVNGDEEPLPIDQFWLADTPGQPGQLVASAVDGASLTLLDAADLVRLTPSLSGKADDRTRPPAVISERLATRFGLGVGDTVSFPLDDGIGRLDCIVAAVVPAVPGAPKELAALIDLGVVQHFQLRTTEVPAAPRDLWAAATDPAAAAAALRPVLPADARVASALDPHTSVAASSPTGPGSGARTTP